MSLFIRLLMSDLSDPIRPRTAPGNLLHIHSKGSEDRIFRPWVQEKGVPRHLRHNVIRFPRHEGTVVQEPHLFGIEGPPASSLASLTPMVCENRTCLRDTSTGSVRTVPFREIVFPAISCRGISGREKCLGIEEPRRERHRHDEGLLCG
ncbi:MAG: hypothetical protein MZV70_02545 [Desulfobacterales bacterium]|nr:hypothetical protein [Desulfobacterales bacterium]